MTAPTTPLAALVWEALGTGYPGGGFAADDPNGYASKLITAFTGVGEEALYAFTDDAWLDPTRTPLSFLLWLAEDRGVDPRGADEATLRAWCASGGPTRQRGTDAAMQLRVQQILTGTKSIRFYPRTDPANPGVDSPGHTLIRTKTSETPGGAASVVAAAYDRAAAVWQIVHSQVLTGKAWDEETGAWNAATGTWEAN